MLGPRSGTLLYVNIFDAGEKYCEGQEDFEEAAQTRLPKTEKKAEAIVSKGKAGTQGQGRAEGCRQGEVGRGTAADYPLEAQSLQADRCLEVLPGFSSRCHRGGVP